MKVFIARSIGEEEHFWITRLAWKLRDEDITPISGYALDMVNPNLMIGIATIAGDNDERFLLDYDVAIKRKIPFLLLVEKGSDILTKLTINNNIVIFERGNIQDAIEIAKQRFLSAEGSKLKPLKVLNEYWGWIVGGGILLATIDLISKLTTPEKSIELT